MSDDKKRVSLTLTRVYIEALDRLVNEGIYLERQEVIRTALRILFGLHGIEPFSQIILPKGDEIERVKIREEDKPVE